MTPKRVVLNDVEILVVVYFGVIQKKRPPIESDL